VALAKVKTPLLSEQIIERGVFQTLRLARFFQKVSENLWNKAFPDTDGTITYYEVSAVPAVASLIRAQLTPYQKDDQTWLLDLNITLTVASGARTGITVTLTNTKFKNLTGLYQPVLAYAIDGTNPYPIRCYAQLNTGNIIFEHASATTTTYCFRAEQLELEEQPAYAE
jgi:hypothetical protein